MLVYTGLKRMLVVAVPVLLLLSAANVGVGSSLSKTSDLAPSHGNIDLAFLTVKTFASIKWGPTFIPQIRFQILADPLGMMLGPGCTFMLGVGFDCPAGTTPDQRIPTLIPTVKLKVTTTEVSLGEFTAHFVRWICALSDGSVIKGAIGAGSVDSAVDFTITLPSGETTCTARYGALRPRITIGGFFF